LDFPNNPRREGALFAIIMEARLGLMGLTLRTLLRLILVVEPVLVLVDDDDMESCRVKKEPKMRPPREKEDASLVLPYLA